MSINLSDFPKSRLLGLYKELLNEARRFPTKNKWSMIQDIRMEWREKASLTDPEKRSRAIKDALHGLQYMKQFSGLKHSEESWNITLDHPEAIPPPKEDHSDFETFGPKVSKLE